MNTESIPTELFELVRSILNEDWDPIGIRSIPIEEARLGWNDEYDMYIPAICQMLIDQRPAIEILQYLLWIETDRMKLPARTEIATNVANKLIETYQLWN